MHKILFIFITLIVATISGQELQNGNSSIIDQKAPEEHLLDLFSLLMKSIAEKLPDVEGVVKLEYGCKNHSIPVSFNTDSKGSPLLLCKEVECLNFKNINCKANVSLEECTADNQWIAGFYEYYDNHKNSTTVQCCEHKNVVKMEFVKNFDVTKDMPFARNETFENDKIVAFHVFNNAKLRYNSQNETFYTISIYEMTCPEVTPGKMLEHKTNSDAFEEKKVQIPLRLISSARQIGSNLRNFKPNRDQKLTTLMSILDRYPSSNALDEPKYQHFFRGSKPKPFPVIY